VARATLDSARRNPANLGKVFSAASAKPLNRPARLTASRAAGLSSSPARRSAASAGQWPARQRGQ
jgi:hypothetical protein